MSQDEVLLNERYKLLEQIGSGGMAVVYLAQDLLLGRLVAVKMLHASFSGDEEFLHRFRHEAYAAAGLQHPNIVTVHDIGQDGLRQYIVMEYVHGQTLKDVIRHYAGSGSTMPISRILDLSIQICDGIGYAHRSGLVHCDVKPQNVLVTRDDRIKVADFGIARAMSEASQQLAGNEMWGTPQYFSPEQAAGKAPSPASDVYAIGVILYEMLTGELPFTAESNTALALKHMQQDPPKVGDIYPAVPEELDLIVEKVLAKEPTGRYRTASQLGSVLSSYRTNSQADTGSLTPVSIVGAAIVAGMPPSEQQTQLFAQPADTAAAAGVVLSSNDLRLKHGRRNHEAGGPDWMAIGLGIIALIALLGLIPLWFFVYMAYAA